MSNRHMHDLSLTENVRMPHLLVQKQMKANKNGNIQPDLYGKTSRLELSSGSKIRKEARSG
jgi:hypothetical protein